MNKKILAGIIAGVVFLVAIIIVIFSLSDKIGINLGSNKKDDASNSSSGSSVTDTVSDNTESGSKTENKGDKDTQTGSTHKTGKDTIEVNDATQKDGKVIVPIYATKNDGIAAARIFVNFDTKVFDYADVTAGDMFDNCVGNYSDGKAVIVATSKEGIYDVEGCGVIANLILVPKSGAKSGEYKVTVDEKSEYANFDGEFAHPTVEAGKIVIK